EQAQPLVLRRLRLGATEQEAPVGDVGVAGPDLLPVDDQRVALALRARAERSQIGACPRLGESLAPELFTRQKRANEGAALGVAAVTEKRGADQIDIGGGRRARRAHLVERLVEEPALDGRRRAATVLARPGDGGPAPIVEEALPGTRHLEPLRLFD